MTQQPADFVTWDAVCDSYQKRQP